MWHGRYLLTLLVGRGAGWAWQPEKRKVGSSTLPLTTSSGLVSSALTSVNADSALPCLSLPSDYDCPCVPVIGRSLSHADRTPRLSAPGSRPLRLDFAVSLSAPIRGVGCGPCAPPLSPIGLTAAVLFAGWEVSSADSRVRSSGTLTCARCLRSDRRLMPDGRRMTIRRQSGGRGLCSFRGHPRPGSQCRASCLRVGRAGQAEL
jgi:hypothetical protein